MDQHNQSFEPMDIDLSAHSSDNMDISYNESNHEVEEFPRYMDDSVKSTLVRSDATLTPPNNSIPAYTINVKRFHINIQKETASSHSTTKFKVVCTAFILCLSLVAYQVLNIQCNDNINVDKLRRSLSQKLFGQAKAIDGLIEGINANEKSKILILYGSTGVGKTFTASMLLEQVGHYSNVYHYTMPSFMNTFTTDFMIGLTVCTNSIFIVDDLSPNDLDVKVHINNLITKADDLEKAVTVILIYNCNPAKDFIRQYYDESCATKIMENFEQIQAYKKTIHFETLKEEHLQKCIKTELGHRRISKDEFTKLLKNFDVSVDGCKGVHTKMKLLDI